jgi:hypothetical protein
LCGKFTFYKSVSENKVLALSCAGHNGDKYFIGLFHVSGHLEQFGGVFFFAGQIYYFGGMG